jgi:UDP-GlcNAc:undecaprenyl-phosphate/decaprenyl-phosphate GlcNAc-1-phosphate transferase
MQHLMVAGLIACVVSYLLTYLISHLAIRWDFIDSPDGHHKRHGRNVALGGGVAVFITVFLVSIATVLVVSPDLVLSLVQIKASYMGGLFLACFWIVMLGLFDDRYGMRGRNKLLGQLVAVIILVSSGLHIDAVTVFGYEIRFGILAYPVTVLWLLGAINSLNLLDGIDGLAATIGIVLCTAIAAMALMIGQTPVAFIAALLAGSLLGFLRFNFPPASIYLGDAGSMLIGLIVGALAIGASLKGPATVALAAPMALWALPLFDSVTAVLRRKLTGRSIYATDRGHLHHCLMKMCGDSNPRVLAVVAICCGITCIGALMSSFMKSDILAIGGVAIVLSILIVTQAFGYVELKMLVHRARHYGRALLWPKRHNGGHETIFHLQGSRQWDLLWQSLVEFADKLQLVEIKLDINAASIQEAYHAFWRKPNGCERQELWRTEIPLIIDQHVIGRLSIGGKCETDMSSCEVIDRLMDMLEPLETRILAMANKQLDPSDKPSAKNARSHPILSSCSPISSQVAESREALSRG